MIKRAAILTVVLAMVGPAVASAQTPGFSGTWELTQALASTRPPGDGIRFSVIIPGINEFLRSSPASTLIITQSGTELTIEQHWTATIESGGYRPSKSNESRRGDTIEMMIFQRVAS